MKRSWKRPLPPWALMFVVFVVAPVAAEAQLFPDIYIKRKRPCPPAEDPRYRLVREQFYGYYPTCWRRFPPGWGCPSPDAPDWQASLRDRPLDYSTLEGGTGDLGADDAAPPADAGSPFEPAAPGTRPTTPPAGDNLPALPQDDDPFRMTPPAGGLPEAAPGDDPGAGPQAIRRAPGALSVPLEGPASAAPADLPALPALGNGAAVVPAPGQPGLELGAALPGPEARPVPAPNAELGLIGASPVAPPLGPPSADVRALVSEPLPSAPGLPPIDPRNLATDPVLAPAPAGVPATANAAEAAPRRSSAVGNFLGRIRRR